MLELGVWLLKESSGCYSNLSNTLTLIYNTGSHQFPTGTTNGEYYTSIGRPVATAVPGFSNKMLVSWTDNAPEEFFEIWRERRGSNGYSTQGWNVIAVLPANTTSFVDDIGIRPNAQYNYSIRAMANNDGRFSQKNITTTYPTANQDNDAPTTPSQLIASNVTQNSITFSWAPSIDNDVVYAYEVYRGTTLVATLTETPATGDLTDGNPHPPTTYTFTGLDQGTTYMLNVRAVDFKQNKSDFPQSLVATTLSLVNGVAYNYYFRNPMPGSSGNRLTNFDFNQTPNQTGFAANFNDVVSIAGGIQNNGDPSNFFLDYTAYLNVTSAGNYRFYTNSDDGSRLYIDGVLVVNSDFDQGATTRSGIVNNLTIGLHTIRVQYYEVGGGNSLTVRYNSVASGTPADNYGSASSIPNANLFRIGVPTFTNYYSKTTGDLNTLGTWTTSMNGIGGTAPSSFANPNQVFNIANRTNTTLSNAWPVSGTNSRVVVGNNITLNLNEALTGKLQANAGSVININHSSIPQLTQLHATSTVNMNIDGTVPQAVYGNLNLNTAATIKTLPMSSTIVNGNLTVADDVIFEGSSSPNRSTLTVAGNITFTGSSSNILEEGQRYSLILDGNGSHTINVNQTDIALAGLDVEGTLNLNFNDANQHTLTVGVPNSSGGLLLRSGAVLQLGNHNLEVNGTSGINPTDDSGEININGGNITVATASGQTSSIYFSDEANTHTVQNLSLSNAGAGQINLVGQTKLTNLMSVDAGTVNMQGDFVLRSTSDAGNGTARIGPLVNGARVAGNITAERYMSGEGRIWRYISSPVKNATAAQLQETFPITGNFTGASVINANSQPSMYQYTEPNYVQFPSVNGSNQEVLQTGRGYSPFIREASASTTYKLTGEPNQGDIPFTLTANAGNSPTLGWNLIGNPYPAPIQWAPDANWIRSGVNIAARVRENSNGQTAVYTYGTDWDGIIAPGQAFWIQTTSASPALTVRETAKVTTDGAFYRIGDEENKVRVTMRNATLKDVAAVRFDVEATVAYDAAIDGIKLDNSFFNISTLTSDNKPVALNNTTSNYCEQEVKLRITNAAAGSYSLDITGVSSLISKDEVTFTDNFTQTQLTVTDALTYAFSITADAASKADGRFTLHFKKPEVVLNQTLKTEAACEQSSPIVLVNNSQPGVSYQAFHNGIAVSDAFMSTGGSLQVLVNPALVGIGTTEVNIKAGFTGCNSYDLPMTISVQRDSLPLPVIIAEPTKLVASTENATYQWYQNGVIVPEQTGKEWLNPENGKYVVEVFKGTCLKASDTLEYIVTSVEKPNRLYQLYPNPTRDKFIITLEEPIDFMSMRVISMIGQVMSMPVSKISEYSAEVDLTEMKTGFYLLQVNGQRYKVLKE
jgi:hypothetical protein